MKMIINKVVEIDEHKGLYIYFNREEVTYIEDIFSITYKDEERYFIVKEIETNENNTLSIKAKEYGYYNKLFGRIDIRSLINKEVKYIDDKEVIKQLEEESRYC